MSRTFRAAWDMASARLSGRVLYLILHVTARCNARCSMCFNWNGMTARRMRPEHTVADLTKLAASMKRLPQLTVSGGEPLLRDDLAEILAAFHTHAHTRLFTVPTNGLLPGKAAALITAFQRQCPGAFLNFCLPFHSADAGRHDAIMGVPDSAARRDETYAEIAEASRAHPNISCVLNFVMSAANHTEYREAIEAAMSRYPAAAFGIAYARGVTHEPGATDFPLQSYVDAHALLARRQRTRRQRMRGVFNPFARATAAAARQFSETVAEVARGDRSRLACHAGRRLLAIYDDGDVRPCELLETRPFIDRAEDASLGDLHNFDYDLARLLDAPKAREVLARLDAQACACTWECAIYSSILNSAPQLARFCVRALRR